MPLKFQINADEIAAQFKEFADMVKADMRKAMDNLATLTRERIVEVAQNGENEKREGALNTSLKTYMDALSDAEEISPGVWVISLDEKALWIEEGMEKHDMKPDLLKGRKSRIIPFRYDRAKTQNTPFTQGLIAQIRQALKRDKLSIKKIEYDKHGSPRIGKLHEYNLGGPRPGKGNTPALTRLNVYQTPLYSDIATKKMHVKREVLTFRTVKKEGQEGKWIHPGLKAKKYMDKAMDQAVQDWEQKILPEIVEKWQWTK
jgi:hypothetical protein